MINQSITQVEASIYCLALDQRVWGLNPCGRACNSILLKRENYSPNRNFASATASDEKHCELFTIILLLITR